MYVSLHTLYIGKDTMKCFKSTQFHFLFYLKVSEIGWDFNFSIKAVKTYFNENWDVVSLIVKYFLGLKNGSWLVWASVWQVCFLVTHELIDKIYSNIHPSSWFPFFFFAWGFYVLLILCQKIQGHKGTWIIFFLLLTKSFLTNSSKISSGKIRASEEPL